MVDDRLPALAALWRRALSRPPHAPGCSCMGGFPLAAPSARELEEDVLDYLAHRYEAGVDSDLARRLHMRLAEVKAGTGTDFPHFLRGLAQDLPEVACTRLFGDLEVTLGSLAGPQARAGRFACV